MESMLTADITPRFIIPFMPGDNWVFSIKNRYTYNLYNGQQSYFLLPGVSWFYLKNRAPLWNIFAGYGLYFPLNYSDSIVYKQGPWISGIHHLSSQWKLELRGQYILTNWTVVSISARDIVTSQRLSISLGILWTP